MEEILEEESQTIIFEKKQLDPKQGTVIQCSQTYSVKKKVIRKQKQPIKNSKSNSKKPQTKKKNKG